MSSDILLPKLHTIMCGLISHRKRDFYPWKFHAYPLAVLKMLAVAFYKTVMKQFKSPHSWISGQAFPLSHSETLWEPVWRAQLSQSDLHRITTTGSN